jgi:hypothetical protein
MTSIAQVFALVSAFLASASSFGAGKFSGQWSTNGVTDDGLQYEAHIDLAQTGRQVTGRWDEGTERTVWEGRLSGTAEGNKVRMGFCSDGAWGNEPFVCPRFAPASDIFVVRGNTLIWYRKTRTGVVLYNKLDRVTK